MSELKLGELLDTPPPGLDEAVAIAKVGLKRGWGAGAGGRWHLRGGLGCPSRFPGGPIHAGRGV